MTTDSHWKHEAERLWDTYRIVLFADWSYVQQSHELHPLAWEQWVYVLGNDDDCYLFSRPGPLQCVDYFRGSVHGYVSGEMVDEEVVLAKYMIKLGGWIERAVTRFQRRFRTRVRAFQMMNGRLLPGRLRGDQGIARLVASYMPYAKASLQSRDPAAAEINTC